MKKENTKKWFQRILLLSLSLLMLTGCAQISDWFKTKKGTLIGNSFTIYQYDNMGDKTLEIHGNRVDIEPYDPEINEDGSKEINSVLDITVDGSQILTVGNTLIFEETGIDKMMGFEEISDIFSDSGLRFIPYDKMVNDIKNMMGKKRLILVYSQMGEPIGVYEGDSVYATVPKDLPKMTRLNIDGKSLYLHRVNYTIIDKELVN